MDLNLADVNAVLIVEWQQMVAPGIAVPAEGAAPWEFRYCERAEFDGAPRSVDCDRIPRGAEMLAGVPKNVGQRVMNGKLLFQEIGALA